MKFSQPLAFSPVLQRLDLKQQRGWMKASRCCLPVEAARSFQAFQCDNLALASSSSSAEMPTQKLQSGHTGCFSAVGEFVISSLLMSLAVKIKKPIKTKFRMPVFNWVALKPNQINGTVFNEIDDERILEVRVPLAAAFFPLLSVIQVDIGLCRDRLQQLFWQTAHPVAPGTQ